LWRIHSHDHASPNIVYGIIKAVNSSRHSPDYASSQEIIASATANHCQLIQALFTAHKLQIFRETFRSLASAAHQAQASYSKPHILVQLYYTHWLSPPEEKLAPKQGRGEMRKEKARL